MFGFGFFFYYDFRFDFFLRDFWWYEFFEVKAILVFYIIVLGLFKRKFRILYKIKLILFENYLLFYDKKKDFKFYGLF